MATIQVKRRAGIFAFRLPTPARRRGFGPSARRRSSHLVFPEEQLAGVEMGTQDVERVVLLALTGCACFDGNCGAGIGLELPKHFCESLTASHSQTIGTLNHANT